MNIKLFKKTRHEGARRVMCLLLSIASVLMPVKWFLIMSDAYEGSSKIYYTSNLYGYGNIEKPVFFAQSTAEIITGIAFCIIVPAIFYVILAAISAVYQWVYDGFKQQN